MFHEGGEIYHRAHTSAKNLAYIVAVDMGYGHERPARAMQHLGWKQDIVMANNYQGIPVGDRNLWEGSRKLYERVSRLTRLPVIGNALFKILDSFQAIEPLYPRRDLSATTIQLRSIYSMIHHKNYGKHLIEQLQKQARLPLLSTFFVPAFMAEEHGYEEDIYVLATDSDISRAWAPLKPERSRITYLAPTGRVVERLQLYGVKRENIILTGFPLDKSLIGDERAEQVRLSLRARLQLLDPQGIFYERYAHLLEPHFPGGIHARAPRRLPTITFAVGGAGAQTELAITVMQSLAKLVTRKKIQLNVVAGTRADTYQAVRTAAKKLTLNEKKHPFTILFTHDRETYFSSFNEILKHTDILWTKPSELSFYAGVGLPIVMAPPVGAQERYNALWLQQMGAGIAQFNPEYAHEWLIDWINSGALARMAWNGFIEAPTHGIFRIEDVLAGESTEFPPLPMVV